jgi:hypothetical protein
MTVSLTVTVSLALLALGTQVAPEKQFKLIADAVTSADTCEQLGFAVNRSGLADWGEDARQQAVSLGWTYEAATSALFTEVDAERQRVLQRQSRVLMMSHSIDNTDRHKRHWQKRCDKLASSPLSSAYFSNSS